MKALQSLGLTLFVAFAAIAVASGIAHAEPYVGFNVVRTEVQMPLKTHTVFLAPEGTPFVQVDPRDLQAGESTNGKLEVGYRFPNTLALEAGVNVGSTGTAYTVHGVAALPLGRLSLVGKAGAMYLEANVMASYEAGLRYALTKDFSISATAGITGHGGDIDRVRTFGLGFVKSF